MKKNMTLQEILKEILIIPELTKLILRLELIFWAVVSNPFKYLLDNVNGNVLNVEKEF
jgi:fructose-specific phosphotransferase system IIC component